MYDNAKDSFSTITHGISCAVRTMMFSWTKSGQCLVYSIAHGVEVELRWRHCWQEVLG
jgi:hypothetical protein